MNKFNKSKSINNKNLFFHNPPSILVKNEEIPKTIEEIPKTIEELQEKIQKVLSLEETNNDMFLSFPEIHKDNIEIIPEKDIIKIKPMKNLKLVVDEVILNLRKNKKNGWDF